MGSVAVSKDVTVALSSKLSYEDWLALGKNLRDTHEEVQWSLGDWVVFGTKKFEHAKYAAAAKTTGLDPKTLSNYGWVASKFESSRRREDVSWGHHADVASLPEKEQDAWLQKAADNKWNKWQFREALREEKTIRAAQPLSNPLRDIINAAEKIFRVGYAAEKEKTPLVRDAKSWFDAGISQARFDIERRKNR